MFDFLLLALLVGAVFGICWLVDKGFARIFRGTARHKSGKSVRLNRHFGGIGTAVAVLGVMGVLAGIPKNWLLMAAGGILILTGAGLVVYYMTFGIYYDEEGFVLSSFGKRSVSHTYGQIEAQQLYISQGKTVIELHFQNGQTITLQHGMKGVDKFMDQAFAGWLKATGKSKDDCDFHDPDNSCWFPPVEE